MAPDYPHAPVRYVVPFGSGPTDVQARWLAHALSRAIGQPVTVENHPGEGGMKGTAHVAKAAPDGYTLLAANPGPLTVGPNVRGSPGYDPLRDLAPVILLATVTSVVAVHPALPVATLGELLAYDRAHPGALRFGSPGTGTVGHLGFAYLQQLAGTRMTHVPHEGLEAATPALVHGRIDALIVPMPDAFPLAQQGRIRALAGTKRVRSARMPDLPTVEEAGVPGFESFNWNGVAAPAGTPAQIVARLNAELDTILYSAEGRHYFAGKGYEIAGGTPAAFGAFIRGEYEKWNRVSRLAGIIAG